MFTTGAIIKKKGIFFKLTEVLWWSLHYRKNGIKAGTDVVPLLKLAQVTAASNKLKKKHWHCRVSGQKVFFTVYV